MKSLKGLHRRAIITFMKCGFRPFSTAWGLLSPDTEEFILTVVGSVMRPVHRLYDVVYYWFVWRFIPRHRYNVVYTNLPPGYYDKDTRMLHACFSLLADYVEDECFYFSLSDMTKEILVSKNPEAIAGLLDIEIENRMRQAVAYPPAKASAELLTTMRDLYIWWRIERPSLMKALDESDYKNVMVEKRYNQEFTENTHFDIEMLIYDEDDVMLMRLMYIRRALWT